MIHLIKVTGGFFLYMVVYGDLDFELGMVTSELRFLPFPKHTISVACKRGGPVLQNFQH